MSKSSSSSSSSSSSGSSGSLSRNKVRRVSSSKKAAPRRESRAVHLANVVVRENYNKLLTEHKANKERESLAPSVRQEVVAFVPTKFTNAVSKRSTSVKRGSVPNKGSKSLQELLNEGLPTGWTALVNPKTNKVLYTNRDENQVSLSRPVEV